MIYVSAGGAILVFARAADGKLSLQSCVNDAGSGGCANVKIANPWYMTLSPDGSDLVVNSVSNGFMTFDRDAASGNLTQRPGPDVCMTVNGTINDNGAPVASGCRSHPASGSNGRPVFGSADQFYASFYNGSSIIAIKRDYYPRCLDQSLATTVNTSIAVAFGCSDATEIRSRTR